MCVTKIKVIFHIFLLRVIFSIIIIILFFFLFLVAFLLCKNFHYLLSPYTFAFFAANFIFNVYNRSHSLHSQSQIQKSLYTLYAAVFFFFAYVSCCLLFFFSRSRVYQSILKCFNCTQKMACTQYLSKLMSVCVLSM